MEYTKPAFTHEELIKRYDALGLNIENKTETLKSLSFIGHFRLSPYLKYYRDYDSTKYPFPFKASTSFEDVIKLYSFDSNLRNLTLCKIEKIEIGIKTLISNELSLKLSPLWYLDNKLFKNADTIQYLKEKINEQRNSSLILKHFYTKYTSSVFPPSWMMIELISFGAVDRIYKNLHRRHSKPIADKLNTSPEILITWLRTLSNLRNFCAHHHRIWNRVFQFRPSIPDKFSSSSRHLDTDKFFIRSQIMNFILKQIDNDDDWQQKLLVLIRNYSEINVNDLGVAQSIDTFKWWK